MMPGALWSALWPNIVAPSLWTVLAVAVAHWRARVRADARHRELRRHITDTYGDGGGVQPGG